MEQDQKIYNLVAAAKQGDSNAFTELYNLSYKMVYHTCYGSLKNQEDAEDATQEVFIYVYTKLNDLADNYAYYGWVKQIALHTSYNKVRARKDNASYDDAIGNEEVIEGDDNLEMLPDTYVLRDEKRKIVMEIMETTLSEVQYQTLFMYYYSDLKIEQIAEIMGVSEGTVKTRLKSAKVKVKEGIEAYEQKTGDRLAVAGAIPSIAMVFKKAIDSIPMRLIAFKGIAGAGIGAGVGAGAFGAAGNAVAQGVAKVSNSMMNMGGHASGSIPQGMGAGAQAQIPGSPVPNAQVPGNPVPGGSVPGAQVPDAQIPGAQPSTFEPQVPGDYAPDNNPFAPSSSDVNPDINSYAGNGNAAVETATKGAAKSAGKGVAKKIVAGVAAAAVLGAGTFGVMALLNKNDDKSKKREKRDRNESVETTASVESVPGETAALAVPSQEIEPLAAKIEVGDVVTMGKYAGHDITWRVLDEKDGNYLVITEYLIRQGGSSVSWEYTWGTSDTRTWLENDFLNSFGEDEKARIQDTTHVTHNLDYNQDLRDETTTDKVFLLDMEETRGYFQGNSDRACYKFNDGSDNDRHYYGIRGHHLVVGVDGNICQFFGYDDNQTYMRPAMWVNLDGMEGNVQKGVYKHDTFEMPDRTADITNLNCAVGGTVNFGYYGGQDISWNVVAENNGSYLLVSEYVIDAKSYDDAYGVYKDVKWETCSLRQWLNGDFYNMAFLPEEQGIINTTTVTAEVPPVDSSWIQKDQGNDTQDKVFLLSYSEVNTYMSSLMTGTPTAYARERSFTDAFNPDAYSDQYIYWWTRTLYEGNQPYYCNSFGINGSYEGLYVSNVGVRPAIWITP